MYRMYCASRSTKRESRFAPRRRSGAPGYGRGTILLFTTIILSFVFLALASGILSMAVHQTNSRVRYGVYKDEFAAAEEALNKAFGHVQFLVRSATPDLPTEIQATPQPIVSGFDILDFAVAQISAGAEAVTEGPWRGLTLNTLRYRVSARVRQQAYNNPDSVPNYFVRDGVTLAQNFNITYIPIYHFAIFYDPDMEIAPGANMWVRGRVHTNSNGYFQSESGASLSFYDRVSAAGEIFHGRHPDSGKSDANGTVMFSDANNWDGSSYSGSNLETMARTSGDSNGDGWLDSRDSDWTPAAVDRWNGYVEDTTHGAIPLDLPIPPVTPPHAIIERALSPGDPGYSASVESEKFENIAGVVIAADSSGNIAMTRQDGTSIQPYYYVNSSGTVYLTPGTGRSRRDVVTTSPRFYDQREGKYIRPVEVNLGYLRQYSTAYPTVLPANGVLYVTGENRSDGSAAVRLVNGSQLPVPPGTTGFSIATDDPLYVQGDYNTVNRTRALVAGDAVTVLSNYWNDTRSDSPSDSYSYRTATATTMNAVFMNGIVPSADNNYSGGVENYFRFLENWGGRNFVFNGSIVQLWQSMVALGKWRYGNPVYDAPNRVWAWDAMLSDIDGPPAAPRVVEIVRNGWEISSAEAE
ncbi:hypothetical protein JW916_01730 [Candidatus Sumerlaeota bacterium]|nr:hypothetical protein [Candidatus Sumerlaeota bacterium]